MSKEPGRQDLDPRMEKLRDYLLAMPGTDDDFPFGPNVMVFRVLGKMFALMSWEENPVRINLKCDPDRAVELREMYPGIIPGYHMNKQHWNTVIMDDSVPMELARELMDHSYELVFRSLPKKTRENL